MPRSVTDNVIDHFLTVSSRIYAQERALLDEQGFEDLTLNEIRIVAQVDRLEKPTMTKIATKLSLTLGSLTTAITKIEQKGYLKRKQSKVDKRVYIPVLTKKGKKAASVYNGFFTRLILACNKNFKKGDLRVLSDWMDFMHQYEDSGGGQFE